MRSTSAELYRPIAPLGRGGMADVWLALSVGPGGFHKLVVLKELRSELCHSQEFVTMFLDEARLAARLSHPSIVHTYGVSHEGSRLFIAMEFLEGQPLHYILQRGDGEWFDLGMHLQVLSDVLAALAYAHSLQDYDGNPLGIVHRDISPHNVFVTYSGEVKLVDFGIAKGMDSSIDTSAGLVRGKAAYMSPEQAGGRVVDQRSDLFSVGVMLWEAIVGRRMWRDLPDIAIVGRLIAGDVRSPSSVNPDIAPALDRLCNRALAPAPADRFQTAGEFRSELIRAMSELGLTTTREGMGLAVSAEFALERRKLRARISHEFAEYRAETASSSTVADRDSQTPLEFGSGTKNPAIFDDAVERDSKGVGTNDELPTLRPPAFRARRLRFVKSAVALGVAVVGAAAAALVIQSRPARPGARTTAETSHQASPLRPRGGCLTDGKPLIELSGPIERDATLGCENDYLLKFNVVVTEGVSLTIEPGTTIYGDYDTHGTLVVQPGGRLLAAGSADAPIVFTSKRPHGQRRAGDWGGVVILGRARTNLRDDHDRTRPTQVEGITVDARYGGDDDDDSSGVLRFIRVEFAGVELAPGNEVNGLTLAGVGRGTTLDHIQIRHVLDDCFEFFGGTARAKYLVCQDPGDDGFDWDVGYRGKLQFLVLQQGHLASAHAYGLEGDNDPNGSLNEPMSAPMIFNASLCGASRSVGAMLRGRTHLVLANSVLTGFASNFVVPGPQQSAIDVRDSLLAPEAPGPSLDPWLRAGNRVVGAPLGGCFDEHAPSFAPAADHHAPAPPDDGFFDPEATYAGAISAQGSDWTRASWLSWEAP